ncbi:MAG: hypothetical protein IPJ86_14430 [Bacteroidetes bacterium]|nr:hypothetical protein [Bacteroidota bacterium]
MFRAFPIMTSAHLLKYSPSLPINNTKLYPNGQPAKSENYFIIDDEEEIKNLTVKIVSLEGYTVVQGFDRKTLWKKLEQGNIDVVLLR